MKQIFLALVTLTAFSCSKPQTEVEPTLDFALYTQPTSNTITAGQTIEIMCDLHKSYFYAENAEFAFQYEQSEGFGSLSMEGARLKSGKSYTIPKGEFTLHYTAQGDNHHKIQLTVTDQFSNHEYQTIQFTNL